MTEVRADLEDLRRRRRSRAERLDDRLEALALGSGLDPLVCADEPASPLGDRAVHLRVRPAVLRSDLGVREPVRLHHQRLRLVGLERSQRLGRAADALLGGELVLHAALDCRHERVEVEVVAGDGVHAGAADRHRLVPNDDLEPRDLGRRVHGLDTPDEDLERALVGVERIVVAEGGLPGDAQQRAFVAGDDLAYACMRISGESVDPGDSQLQTPPGCDSMIQLWSHARRRLQHDLAETGA